MRTASEWAALDLAHLWHPFTPHDEWARQPMIVVDRAEGVTLYDVDGRAFLDGVSSLWCNVHGHHHPRIDAAVRAQLDKVAHTTQLGLANTTAIELGARLVQLTRGLGIPDHGAGGSGSERPAGGAVWPGSGGGAPLGGTAGGPGTRFSAPPAGRTRTEPPRNAPPSLPKVFYSDSGSTAVEVALKMAFQCQQQRGNTRRTRFAALQEAYHGDTIGSVSVGGMPLFHGIYKPMLFDAVRIPAPDRAGDGEEVMLAEAARLFAEHGDTLAAFVFEPLVQGAAGMRSHSPAFLRALTTMARDAGALLVADEVATGFGRTGTMFAMEQVGVAPDFLCVAKGLTGGYLPLAATLTTEAVFDAFRGPPSANRTFFHGHTYTGNPLACAAALASLDLFEEEQIIAGLPRKVESLRAALGTLHHPAVRELRQVGLMAAVVLGDFPSEARVGHRVALACRDHGAILRNLGDAVVLMPPLAMEPDDLRRLVDALGAAIVDVVGASS